MNFPFGLFLYGVAFFGFLTLVNALQAHRKKEKAYYLAAMISFVVLLAFLSAFLNQFIIAFILIIATGTLSIAGLPKLLRTQEQELSKQLQKVDLSAPLRVRDFFTNIGWFKLSSKWELWKTMFLFYLLSMVIIGAIFSIVSTFIYSFITMGYVVGYTATVSILVTLIFYQQLKKALEKE